MSKQLLKTLKEEYRKKYIQPLIDSFPKPLKMFDTDQVRLRKQIEDELILLDSAIICPDCKGRRVIFKKNELTTNNKWNTFCLGQKIDLRFCVNDCCLNCYGDGIIVNKKKDTPINNNLFKEEEIGNLKCIACKKLLVWELDNNFNYIAECHNIQYILKMHFWKSEIILKE